MSLLIKFQSADTEVYIFTTTISSTLHFFSNQMYEEASGKFIASRLSSSEYLST